MMSDYKIAHQIRLYNAHDAGFVNFIIDYFARLYSYLFLCISNSNKW